MWFGSVSLAELKSLFGEPEPSQPTTLILCGSGRCGWLSSGGCGLPDPEPTLWRAAAIRFEEVWFSQVRAAAVWPDLILLNQLDWAEPARLDLVRCDAAGS